VEWAWARADVDCEYKDRSKFLIDGATVAGKKPAATDAAVKKAPAVKKAVAKSQ
jgi:hypothetical protein